MKVYVFVWGDSDWGIYKGYVTTKKKAEKVRDILEDWAEWFEEFTVSGFNLELSGIKNIELKGGEIIVKK